MIHRQKIYGAPTDNMSANRWVRTNACDTTIGTGLLESFHVLNKLVQLRLRVAMFLFGILCMWNDGNMIARIINCVRQTSHFFSHWSRSASIRCTWRSKCSALTSTCLNLEPIHTRSVRMVGAPNEYLLLHCFLHVLLCCVELLFKKRYLPLETLACTPVMLSLSCS